VLTTKIFIPSLSLAFEYQGQSHFIDTAKFGPAESSQQSFQRKLNEATKLGIQVVQVPYWWDGKVSSLAATGKQIRPELIENIQGTPIPTTKPTTGTSNYIPSVAKEYLEWNPSDW
jgi:hypothetical protein